LGQAWWPGRPSGSLRLPRRAPRPAPATVASPPLPRSHTGPSRPRFTPAVRRTGQNTPEKRTSSVICQRWAMIMLTHGAGGTNKASVERPYGWADLARDDGTRPAAGAGRRRRRTEEAQDARGAERGRGRCGAREARGRGRCGAQEARGPREARGRGRHGRRKAQGAQGADRGPAGGNPAPGSVPGSRRLVCRDPGTAPGVASRNTAT
jgi:hypothetical protein